MVDGSIGRNKLSIALRMIGYTLSHFRITAKLGEGGMGAVYRADDIRLSREVAIKVLPEAVSSDPEHLARFEREARVLASLNHPGIAAIHEVDQADVEGAPVHFLVMELVAGETLAEQIAYGPMPTAVALPIALQISEALEAAHEQGIVHRDLKPANIMVDEDGRVKLLDFGLAKAWETQAKLARDLTQSPTLTAEMTRAGVILGTAAYMSPEQARGRPLDRRADIWAFGCVLYEMLSGGQAFGGRTATEALARILEREPDWDQLPETTPAAIRTLVRRCLAKDPRRRLHDIGDARLEIEETLSEPPKEVLTDEPEVPARVGLGRAAALALGGAAVAALLTWLFLRPGGVSGPPRASLALSLEQPLNVTDVELRSTGLLSLASDGSAIAYLGRERGEHRVYVVPMDGSPAFPVPGTEGTRSPVLSPDGSWLGFVEGRELKAVRLGGGAPVSLGMSRARSRASWIDEGSLVYSGPDGVFRVDVADPDPVRLTVSEGGTFDHDPVVLPGGDAVLLASRGPLYDDSCKVVAVSLRTGERRVLVEEGGSPTYVPSTSSEDKGYLVFAFEGLVYAAPFDLTLLELTGPPAVVLTDVLMRPNGDGAQFGVSRDGMLVYAVEDAVSELVWVDRDGQTERLFGGQRRFAMPRLSPDGTRLAIEIHEVPHQIWLLDIRKGVLSRFTHQDSNHYFAWHPDGQSILYSADSGEGPQLMWKRVDSVEAPVTVYSGAEPRGWIGSVSRDARAAAIFDAGDVFVLPLDGASPPRVTGPPISVATSRFSERDPWISPDGGCVAYTSRETGTWEVYVRCLDQRTRLQVSASGGREPVWSRTGEELYFRSESRMMVVDVWREPEFRFSTPRVLFEGNFQGFDPANFDVDLVGDRFVRLQSTAPPSSERFLSIRLDWLEELEARISGSRR